MSSTNRGAKRDLDDYYATPPPLARFTCDFIERDYGGLWAPRGPRSILEPGCGAGSFLLGASEVWPSASLIGVERSPELARKAEEKGFVVAQEDVLKFKWGKRFDLIVGNPPFTHAEAFIHHLRPMLSDNGRLAFLLRLNFAGSQARYETLWSKYRPVRVHNYVARPNFLPADLRKGGDSIEYGVFVFAPYDSPTTEVVWEDNRAIVNRWEEGEYEDPRGLWFPADTPDELKG